MTLMLSILLMVGLRLVESYEFLTPPTSTRADIFPYHAVIETEGWWCNGVILSTNFVLTRGSCIIPNQKTMIYLGFTRNPYISGNLMDSAGQTFHAEGVFIHDEFGKLDNQQFVNNLALIKLHKPLVPTATVQPVSIASPDDYPIPPGTYINVTGFRHYEDDSNLQYTTCQMRHIDTCVLYFGDSFLKHQERCVLNKGAQRSKWAGPYVINGVLVGIQRSLHFDAKCQVSSPPCSVHDVFLSLENYLEWIYRISDVAGAGASFFQYNNPYWQYRPEKVQSEAISNIQKSVVDIQESVQACKALKSEFITSLQNAIERNVDKDLTSLTLTLDFADEKS